MKTITAALSYMRMLQLHPTWNDAGLKFFEGTHCASVIHAPSMHCIQLLVHVSAECSPSHWWYSPEHPWYHKQVEQRLQRKTDKSIMCVL